jgi:hypothetical protein
MALGPELAFKYPIKDDPEFAVHQIRDLAPSPDGRRLAFTALDRLYLMDYLAGSPRRLTKDEQVEAQPTWSPDGQWIGYVTWRRAGGSMAKVRADGSAPPVPLTTVPATYQQPAWSADGARIVVLRGPAEPRRVEAGLNAGGTAAELVSDPATGGAATVIAPAFGRGRPHFTGDSGRICLSSDSGLVSIRWDGTDQRRHLVVTAPVLLNQEKPNPADRIRMAPHGDQALIQAGYDVYLVTVPAVGEVPTVALQDPKTAAVPVLRLTEIGGEFATWSADAQTVFWGMGSAVFSASVAAAKAFDARVAAELKALATDTTPAGKARADSVGKRKFQPTEQMVTVSVPRDIPRGTVVLRGARVITMRGAEVIEGDVVVRDNRIVSVGPGGSAPAGARVIDVSGKIIVPCFIDTHAHMWASWGVHHEQPWMFLANLAYGVTTTRDPQTSSSDVVSYGDLVEAGQMIGPRLQLQELVIGSSSSATSTTPGR